MFSVAVLPALSIAVTKSVYVPGALISVPDVNGSAAPPSLARAAVGFPLIPDRLSSALKMGLIAVW